MTSDCLARYADLPSDQRKTLKQLAAKIRQHATTTTKAILEIGTSLIEVKGQLSHGAFAEWVAVECGFSMRSAQNYIRAATFVDGKSATVALLAPAAIYRLSAKNASPAIVADVLKRIEAGHVPTDLEVTALFARPTSHRPRQIIGRVPPSAAPKAKAADENREREAALASELLGQLGGELARRFTESDWKLVVECLRELLDASSPIDEAASPALAEVNFIRDPDNSNLYRPTIVPEFEVAPRREVPPNAYCSVDHSADGAIPVFLCCSCRQHPIRETSSRSEMDTPRPDHHNETAVTMGTAR